MPIRCNDRGCKETWELAKGMTDGDHISCVDCGRHLNIKYHSTTNAAGEIYVLCPFCITKMTIITVFQEFQKFQKNRKYVPFEETK